MGDFSVDWDSCLCRIFLRDGMLGSFWICAL